jgi:HPt (histidine-containing phosphotransfer) domain-containing protein
MNPANNNSRATAGAVPAQATVGENAVDAATGGVAGTGGKDTVSLARIDRLRNSIPGKDSLLDELIDLFVCDLPKRLSAIAQAVERADAPGQMNLALQAHALRGSAAIFGASRLDELCGKLEEIGIGGALAEAPAMLIELGRESVQVREALLELKSKPLATPAGAPPPARR